MPISELRDRTRQGFLEFAWHQWAQAGVSANISGFDRWAIDPEALILFTVAVARRDPRLFDEVLDWFAKNRRLLTIQRLRNLSTRFPLDPRLVGAVTAWAGESAPSNWFKNQQKDDATNVHVFDSDVLSFIGELDPVFSEYGYIRPRVLRSNKSREPDVKIPANFSFQLRYLFGPGSRSEVMRMLLTFTDGPLDTARISGEAGFAKRNISDTLISLVDSRVIKSRWSGNERNFLAYRNKWATLLEVGPSAEYMPSYMPWVHLFPACLEIMNWLDRTAETNDSDYLVSSGARNLVERVSHGLEMAGIDVSSRRSGHGEAYLVTFEDIVASLLAKMNIEL